MALSASATAQSPAALNTITRVEVKAGAVEITGTQKPSFSTFPMTDPPRLVVDISEAVFSGVPETMDVASGHVVAIRTASYGNDASAIARVVIGFDREVEPDIQSVGNRLVVRATPAPTSPLVASAAPVAPSSARPAVKVANDGASPPLTAPPAAPQAASPAAVQQAPPAATAAAADQPAPDAAAVAAAAAAEKRRQDAAAAAEAQRRQDAAAAEEKQRQQAAAAAAAADEKRRQDAAAAAAAAAEKQRLEEAAAAQAAAEQRRRQEAAAAAAAEEQRRQAAAAAAAAEEARRQQEAAAAASARQKQQDEAAAAAAEESRKREAALAAAAAERERQQQAAATAAAAEEKRRQQAASAAALEERHQAQLAQAAERERKQELLAAAAAPAPAPTPAPTLAAPEGGSASGGTEVDSKRKALTLVGFDGKVSRVYVRTSGPVRYSVSLDGKNTVVIQLSNTGIPVHNNTRMLDTAYFAGPVLRIQPGRGPNNTVRVAITLRDAVAYETHQDGNEVSVQFRAP